MESKAFEHKYFGTYWFADVVSDILEDPFPYLRNLEDHFGDGRYLSMLQPYQRYSALHGFIEFILEGLFDEQVTGEDLLRRQEQFKKYGKIPSALLDMRPNVLFIERALLHYSMPHVSFTEWLKARGLTFLDASDNELEEYHLMLRDEGPYFELLERLVSEVFFLLFQNRRTLRAFNRMIAAHVTETDDVQNLEGVAEYFAGAGVLRRANIPAWAQRAVFFRDRGKCTLCGCDLSGLLTVSNVENYDHIVPLAKGGINDVSNLQLLCRACNQNKLHRSDSTSDIYEAWYPMQG